MLVCELSGGEKFYREEEGVGWTCPCAPARPHHVPGELQRKRRMPRDARTSPEERVDDFNQVNKVRLLTSPRSGARLRTAGCRLPLGSATGSSSGSDVVMEERPKIYTIRDHVSAWLCPRSAARRQVFCTSKCGWMHGLGVVWAEQTVMLKVPLV